LLSSFVLLPEVEPSLALLWLFSAVEIYFNQPQKCQYLSLLAIRHRILLVNPHPTL